MILTLLTPRGLETVRLPYFVIWREDSLWLLQMYVMHTNYADAQLFYSLEHDEQAVGTARQLR